jgi:hypothetical protein
VEGCIESPITAPESTPATVSPACFFARAPAARSTTTVAASRERRTECYSQWIDLGIQDSVLGTTNGGLTAGVVRRVCAHLEEGERVDSTHWYLLPFLEWLASNRNPLLHDERPPVQNMADSAWESLQQTRIPPPAIEEWRNDAAAWEETWHAWWMRHSIRAPREGGLFPDIVLRRWRDQVEISWGGVSGVEAPEHYQFL